MKPGGKPFILRLPQSALYELQRGRICACLVDHSCLRVGREVTICCPGKTPLYRARIVRSIESALGDLPPDCLGAMAGEPVFAHPAPNDPGPETWVVFVQWEALEYAG